MPAEAEEGGGGGMEGRATNSSITLSQAGAFGIMGTCRAMESGARSFGFPHLWPASYPAWTRAPRRGLEGAVTGGMGVLLPIPLFQGCSVTIALGAPSRTTLALPHRRCLIPGCGPSGVLWPCGFGVLALGIRQGSSLEWWWQSGQEHSRQARERLPLQLSVASSLASSVLSASACLHVGSANGTCQIGPLT
jgi:hypothetical protein